MRWLNEPARWSEKNGVLTVTAGAGTDFWCTTGYGYVRDNGHLYGEDVSGDFDLSLVVAAGYADQYDQAGAMLRADERHWVKTGVEFLEGRPRFSTVVTAGQSSWAVADLPDSVTDIGLRVSRRGDAVEVRYWLDTGQPGANTPALAALVYLPPEVPVLAGAMCAAPEGQGFEAAFRDLRISPGA